MTLSRYAAILALAVGSVTLSALAQDRAKAEPGGPAGKWSTRTPVKPDPSKIKVPPGYKVGVFASGLDTVTSITVDGQDNVWVAISGNTFGFPPEGIDPIRRAALEVAGRRMQAWYESALEAGLRPPGVDSDRHAIGRAIIRTIDRAIAADRLSRTSLEKVFNNLIRGVLVNQGDWSAKNEFALKYGMNPPDILLISPTKTCNLRCVGCYADWGPTREKLTWQVFDRLLGEAHDLWGLRFFVISGGEPLSYRDEGKTLLDAAAKYSDCFFMTYTNGTLIDDRMAASTDHLSN